MIEWDIITQTIVEEKCVLFIGPEILSPSNEENLQEALIKFLDVENNPNIKKYYEDVELFLFESDHQETLTYYKIKEFYNQEFAEAKQLFEKIAKIPFHLIISINPDDKLSQAFNQLGRRHKFDFYWKKITGDGYQEIPISKSKRPLIYNLLGYIGDRESMILSYDDLFEYFDSVTPSVIPDEVRLKLKTATNLIFLGFDFEKWYLQLLLRFIYPKKEKRRLMKYALNSIVVEKAKSFAVDQFKIEFIPSEISEFVSELHDACRNKGVLKSADEDILARIQQLVEEDELPRAMEQLRLFLKELAIDGQEMNDQLTILKRRLRDVKSREMVGISSEKDILDNIDKINAEFLNLIKEARKLD